jgi:hypothetical protein
VARPKLAFRISQTTRPRRTPIAIRNSALRSLTRKATVQYMATRSPESAPKNSGSRANRSRLETYPDLMQSHPFLDQRQTN